jgi:DnaK suppressor protein
MPSPSRVRAGRPGLRKLQPPEPVTSKDIQKLKQVLLKKREQLAAQVIALKHDAVADHDSSNWEEDGTDAFEREFAFKMAGSGHNSLQEIEESLRRIEEKTYGACDMCSEKIGRLRMEALPFCKTCINCQSESEADRSAYLRIRV